jgi:hypothetical protein
MFFGSGIVFVEGIEDLAYIGAYMRLTGKSVEMRRRGCHVVPVGGKSHLLRPIAIGQRLGIPLLVVFDADGDQTTPTKRRQHERDNKAILKLRGCANAACFPSAPLWEDGVVVWPNNIADTLRGEVGVTEWDRAEASARVTCDAHHAGSMDKNAIFIGELVSELLEAGHSSPSMDRLAARVLSLA